MFAALRNFLFGEDPAVWGRRQLRAVQRASYLEGIHKKTVELAKAANSVTELQEQQQLKDAYATLVVAYVSTQSDLPESSQLLTELEIYEWHLAKCEWKNIHGLRPHVADCSADALHYVDPSTKQALICADNDRRTKPQWR